MGREVVDLQGRSGASGRIARRWASLSTSRPVVRPSTAAERHVAAVVGALRDRDLHDLASGDERRVTDVAAAAEEILAPLERASHLAWWETQVEATDANGARRAVADMAWSDALADPELFAAVEAARAHEPTRSLELLRNLMLTQQVPGELRSRIVELETSVDIRFSRHRGVVGGVEVDDTAIKKILRQSDDPTERREAWEASKTVGAAVADDVRELARLRNEAARTLGYRDWFALSLAKDELDEEKLVETLADADAATAQPFARWKSALDEQLAGRFGCAVADLRPWHYADPFFQEAPPDGAVDLDPLFDGQDVVGLARRTMDGIGLEVDGIIARSDLFPRDGKNQHAFCVDIDRAGDVRVLANLASTHESADTMLHELGHGVYELGLGDDLSWLQRIDASRDHRGVGSPLRLAGRAKGLARARARAGRFRGRRARAPAPRLSRDRARRVHALGPRHDRVRARALCESRRRPRRRVVGARRTPPARHAAGRPQRARLGREDPHRGSARLLPHLSLRSDRRAAAGCRARRAGGRDRRPPRRGCASAGEALRAWGIGALGRARRARLGVPLSVAALGREMAQLAV